MQASSISVTKPDLLKALYSVFRQPDDSRALCGLADMLERIGRLKSLGKIVSWYTACVLYDPRNRDRASNGDVNRLLAIIRSLQDDGQSLSLLGRAVRAFPQNPITHNAQSFALLGSNEPDAAGRSAKRTAIVRPDLSVAYRAAVLHASAAGDDDAVVTFLRHCTILQPGTAKYHFDLAFALIPRLPIDEPPAGRVTNAMRRAIVLDPLGCARNSNTMAGFRRIGDMAGMAKALDRNRMATSPGAGPGAALGTARFFKHFQALVESLRPLEVHRDFPARALGSRVLVHPRLPDDGPWVLRGPADQCERARRILAYVNPTARVMLSSDAGADAARPLSLVPSDDPDCWLMPCMYGHWQVYWTVLPAILDEHGEPSVERALEFCTRTRQFVQFWYPKGHEALYLKQHAALGRSIAERMGDEASRVNYLTTLGADHRTYIRDFLQNICHRVQYFDYAVYRPGDVILNLGVSEGFEVPALLALISPGGTLHNIDPEGDDALGDPARWWIEGSRSDVVQHRLALTDVDGEIEMETGGCWEDTRVSKRQIGQRKTIPARRLDTFIAENDLDRIDHIKLDIEGGEGFLLDQLIEVMRTHRPQIEISIYHTVEQFLEIPDRMMRESTGYKFFFYHYCGHFGEGTLYAIPEEIAPLMPICP